jgi:uncharacterized membrane protein
MAYADPNAPRPPPPQAVSNTTLAMIVYVLYFVSYFFLLTAVVGVIIAYVQIGAADPMLQTHYRFQIRTFWIGLIYFVAGVILCFVVVGILVLIWWFVWTLVRCIKGILALNEGRPIAQPESWLFG